MDAAKIRQIREDINRAFGPLQRPETSASDVIGCCDQHQESFEWYRTSSVQEFREIVRSGSRLDSAEFGSLRPDFFVYFTRGYLEALLNELEDNGSKAIREYWVFDWTSNYCPLPNRPVRSTFTLFTSSQRKAVYDTLDLLYDAVLEEENGEEEPWNISLNLAEVWKT